MQLTDRDRALLRRTFVDYHPTADLIAHPLVVERTEGLYLWDRDGRRYFDAIGGVFVAVLGHCHPRIMEAMRRQMEKCTFAPPLHSIAETTLDFIEKLGSVAPGTLRFVKPFNSGSEATESSFKFVRQYYRQTGRPGKYKVISRYHSYHGGTFGAMAASGNGARKASFEPNMAGFLKVFPPNHYRDHYGLAWEEANRFAAKTVEDLIVYESPNTVAAVIVEPIGNTGGIITPTPEYFRMLREICDRHDVTLIFDEIITGIAKTGQMFAAQTFGVTPDIICLGKGISSGAVPLSAMIAREDMADAFEGPGRNFAHGHTFAGNPLACAVGIAVLDEVVEKDYCATARRLGDSLRTRLESLSSLGIVREVRGRGVLLGVELNREIGATLKKTALANGLIMRVDPWWFAVAPPLIATEADLDEMCGLIEKSLREALEQHR